MTRRIVLESRSIFPLMLAVHSALGCAISPVGHLLPSLHALPVNMPPMARYGAVAIASPGRVTPLAGHFFHVARVNQMVARINALS